MNILDVRKSLKKLDKFEEACLHDAVSKLLSNSCYVLASSSLYLFNLSI